MQKEVKELGCHDTGMDCDFMVRAYTIEEVLEHCATHVRRQHGMKGFPEELYLKMRTVVRTIPSDQS